jgi:hypothetical protein
VTLLDILIQIKNPLDVLCTYKTKKKKKTEKTKNKLSPHLSRLCYHHVHIIHTQVSCIRSIPQIRPSDRLSFGRLSQVKKMTKLPQNHPTTLNHQKHNNNIKIKQT